GTALFLPQDVTDEARWAEVAQATLDRFGRIDVLVNSAGIGRGGAPILEATYEAWREIIAINLDGTFLGVKAIAPSMAAAGAGSIINISSIPGKVCPPP